MFLNFKFNFYRDIETNMNDYITFIKSCLLFQTSHIVTVQLQLASCGMPSHVEHLQVETFIFITT
jgi:hypothetical protein